MKPWFLLLPLYLCWSAAPRAADIAPGNCAAPRAGTDLSACDFSRRKLAGAALHLDEAALGLDAAAGGEAHDLGLVVRERARDDELQRIEARAVGEVHEADARLGVAARAHPALHHDLAVGEVGGALADVGDGGPVTHRR